LLCSHALKLREGELDSRLRDRDRTIEDLNLRLCVLTTLLRKEPATRESMSQRIAELQLIRVPKRRLRPPPALARRRKPKLLRKATSKTPKKRKQR
jgi:hypothetical protein